MLFSVPQYIDIEDKVVGPLTVKQLLWMIAAGVLTLILWAVLPAAAFFIIAIPEVLFFVAMAFYKPYGQPLVGFLISGALFILGPKVYIWKRTANRNQKKIEQNKQAIESINEKSKEVHNQEERRQQALANLRGIAKILDSDGQQSDEGVVNILKKMPPRK